MRLPLRILAAAGLVLSSGPSWAAGAEWITLESLRARLESAPQVSAEFTQTRALAELERPVRSSGRFAMLAGHGLLWEVTRPYEAVILVGPERLLEVAPGEEARPLPGKDGRFMSGVGQVLTGLFSGEFEPIERHFTIGLAGTADSWEMTLVPKGGASEFLRSLRVAGGRFPESVRIEEASGDVNEIRFSGHNAEITSRDRDLLQFLK